MRLLVSSGSAIDSALHWQCVAICAFPRLHELRVIERHRLIGLYRAGGRMPKAEQRTVRRIIQLCHARRRQRAALGIANIPARRGRKRRAAIPASRENCFEQRDG